MDISGAKTKLSRIAVDDLDFICDIECNRELWQYEEAVQTDREAVRQAYLNKINSNTEHHYDFIVYLEAEGIRTPIGLAQIWSYNEYRKSWEIGFAILPPHSGHGYGTEAAEFLLKFAFEVLQAHKVVGMCNAKNSRSADLMERIGMTREAVFKEELYWCKRWTDQYFYSILEREYYGA
ncbi:N-acetyltransferase [Paenibacillus sp. 1011MAR3C5]|uniref:GNAT family N-acetyltransferase n=1 Tax=Paenibacillus sp. 1011MAR3C5 TaxID=1675787 RepID=UPI000E6D277B|nr:GNAT family N-acetyltransferase [Paenibacillus sp. 1011MAR3C5]RJE88882.1 N-acetyltransferase [Paenibacillus sp. 1011MAR3C5]